MNTFVICGNYGNITQCDEIVACIPEVGGQCQHGLCDAALLVAKVAVKNASSQLDNPEACLNISCFK